MTGECRNCFMKWRGGVDLLPGGVVIFSADTYAGYAWPSYSSSYNPYRDNSAFYRNSEFSGYYLPQVYTVTPYSTDGTNEIVEGSIFHTKLLMKFNPLNR